MKQNIAISQLKELTPEQQIRLRDLWKPKQYDLVAYTYEYHKGLETDKVIIKGLYDNDPTKVEEVSDMEGEYVFPKENCLPILNIGQMFEILLGCSCIDCTKRMLNENTQNKIYGIDLCDALWKLTKEYLK